MSADAEGQEPGVFRAYFDRSQLFRPADVVAVGGFMAAISRWRHFEREWRKVLDRHGMEVFHMTDFETRQKQYATWSNEQRVAFVRQMIGVIRVHAWVAIAAAMVMKDYNGLGAEERRELGHPYALCGLKAVADTLRWVDDMLAGAKKTGRWKVLPKAHDVRIEFVFEAGDEGASELAAALESEKKSGAHGERIWSWTFDNKGSAGALQAADFAAYETTKQLVRTIGADERRIRQSMDRLLQRVTYRAEYFNARSLREVLDNGKKHPAAAMRQA